MVRGHHLLAREAAHRRIRGIDLDGAEIGVPQHQCIGRGIEDRAVLLLAVAQRALRTLALRDVASDVQHMRRAAVLDRHAAQFQLVLVAVAPEHLGDERDRLSGHRLLVQGTDRREHLGRIRQHAIQAQHLGPGKTAHRLVGRVDVDDAEIGGPQHQCVGRCVEDRAVLLLAVAQRLVGTAALRDVAQMAHEDAALGHGRDADRDFHRNLGAVRAHRRGFHQPAHHAPAVLRPEIPDAFLMILAQPLRDDHVGHPAAQDVFTGMAEHPLGRGVEFDDAALAVHRDDTVEGRLDGGAVAGLAALQFALAPAPFADVAHHGQRVRLAALHERHEPQVGIEGGAVRPQHRGFRVDGFAGQRAAHLLLALAHIRLGHAARVGPADELLAAVAIDRESRRVHVDDAQVLVPDEETVLRTLEDRPVLLLPHAQVFQRPLLRRDVPAEGEDVRAAVDHGRLEANLVPVQAAVLVAALPFERAAAAEPCRLHVAQRLFAGVREHARTGVGNGGTAQLLAAVAVGFAGLGVDVDHRAGVPVVDEDRVLRGLEDGAVARLGALQCFAGAQPLDLRRGAHREDLQHGLDAIELGQRTARGHRHDPQRRAVQRHERMARIAHGALLRGHPHRPGTRPADWRNRPGSAARAPFRRACRPADS